MKPSVFVRIPPPVWAFAYVVIALVADQLIRLPSPGDLRQPVLGVVLVALGLVLAPWALLLFRKAKTDVRPSAAEHAALITRGPYVLSRNPMYLSLEFLTLGIAFLVGSIVLFAVPVVLFLTVNFGVIPFEERTMEQVFGEDYRAYKSKVRRWI